MGINVTLGGLKTKNSDGNNLKEISISLGLVVCLLISSISSHASLNAYEPFNYTTSIPNGTASTATGFTGNWTCGTTPSIVAGLTYAALDRKSVV